MRRSAFTAAVAAMWLVLATALAGCQSRTHASPVPSSAPVGGSAQSIKIGGATRTFHLYRPHNLPARAPLVVMLHGGFGTGTQAEQDYGWDQEADRDGFVVVYPDGVDHAWNTGGGCCGNPAEQNTDDVGFIKAMIGAIQGEVPIDPSRVYATGISNGGIMAYRLACDTNLFAAIGPDSATLLGTCPAPKPLSVLHIHGSADTRIPYNGGEGEGYAHINGPPVPSVVSTWRTIDSCTPPTTQTKDKVTTSTATCPDARTVELITITGAGHQWPGSPQRPVKKALLGSDTPSTALNATDVFWQFFAAHPKSDASG
ncbi:polyhydroxybutyrate depolymerase [Catenulispora acidiphila DSM 44928]|uniref:Polyhydroxybutyrate depolymerase n=1 Tax=Catenulispora acidiphila (strain DSM 44928 / JCM 14897 / NBRC 102108 / NRRL B-24433 / ID139908) TaxID=479433 RepID=C7Q4Z7_CATAD|nr:PHB depolymerase family esterase [Catenulispora acidiphila]ACU73945.1 polyhydroxybutyrate depolymerase [Catenulispora acidiphila DSM 44928]